MYPPSGDKLEFPIFDGKETLAQFMKRAKEFELLVKKNKYNIILEFVNALVKSEDTLYTSLTDLSNVHEGKITSNIHHNIKIMDQYSSKLANGLNIDMLELTSIATEHEYDGEPPNIIMFLKRILNSIEYSLISKTVDDQTYYTIKSRPQGKPCTYNKKNIYNINYSL